MKKILVILFFIISITGLYAQSCNAFFNYSIDTLNNVSFTDSSTTTIGNISGWYWDFGNGLSSTAQNPVQNFSPGIHSVCLTISTTDTCTDTYCDTLIINSINPCTGFSISLNVTNSSGPVTSNGSITTTTIGGIPPFSYNWDTGDSTSSVYNLLPGTYCVTVTDQDSCIYTDCANVIYDTLYYCNADFTIQSSSYLNCFQFTDNSSSSNTITNWYWNFGDGNTSTIQNPTHVYLDTGLYIICLSITTSDSCIHDHCDTVVTSYTHSTFSVSGQVYYDFNQLGSGTVELYETNLGEHYPPLFSKIITNGDFDFTDVASGTYKLLAIPDSPTSLLYTPTYFGDKVNWSEAYTLSVFSNLISVDIHLQENTNGIKKSSSSIMEIYPNPFNKEININSKELITSIKIMTISGEILSEIIPVNNKIRINTKFLPAGIYLISVLTHRHIHNKKLIKF